MEMKNMSYAHATTPGVAQRTRRTVCKRCGKLKKSRLAVRSSSFISDVLSSPSVMDLIDVSPDDLDLASWVWPLDSDLETSPSRSTETQRAITTEEIPAADTGTSQLTLPSRQETPPETRAATPRRSRVDSGVWSCQTCKKQFPTLAKVQRHERWVHREKSLKCDECHWTFSNAWHLRAHKMRHTGERPFQCEFCDKKFRKRDSLFSHTRVHTGYAPFQCLLCQKRFLHRTQLHRHSKGCVDSDS